MPANIPISPQGHAWQDAGHRPHQGNRGGWQGRETERSNAAEVLHEWPQHRTIPLASNKLYDYCDLKTFQKSVAL
jgi:hypothetical protein